MDNIKADVVKEAKDLFENLDDIVEGFGIERTASDAADWWVESQYARTDIEKVLWTKSESKSYYNRMRDALIDLGLPA